MRGLLDSGVDLATEMRAPENSVASRRPWPSRPMIWPAASSGIDKVHRDRVEDRATSGGAVAVLACIDQATTAIDDFAVAIGFEPRAIVGRGGDSDRPATASRDRRPSSTRRCAPSRRLVRATPSALGTRLDPSSTRSSVARTVASRGAVVRFVGGAVVRFVGGARGVVGGAVVIGFGEIGADVIGFGEIGADGPRGACSSSDRSWDDRVSILRSRASTWRASSSPARVGLFIFDSSIGRVGCVRSRL